MRRRPAVLALVLLLTAPAALAAQGRNTLPEPVQAGLQRLFASDEFVAERFGPARWIDGGAAYTTVERTASGADIVRHDAATGARSVLIPAAQLNGMRVADYAWSPDAGKLLLFTNTQRVWRDETRGDYWVLDRATGALRQLGTDGPPASLMFAKFSPQGDRVAYVQQGDLYV